MPTGPQTQQGASRLIIVLVGVILALLVAVVYYVAPVPMTHRTVSAQVAATASQLQERQAKLQELQDKEKELEKLEKEIKEINVTLLEWEGKLPTKEEIPALLDDFARVAKENGIVFKRIEPENLITLEGCYKKPIGVETSADYFQTMDLFHVLEFGERIGTVEGFLLKPSSAKDKGQPQAASGAWTPQMDVEMDMAIFALEKS